MQNKYVILLVMLSAFLCPKAMAAELACAKQYDDCEAMGYTKNVYSSSRPYEDNVNVCGQGKVLHCPSNPKKIFCIPKVPVPVLYGDGTVSRFVLSGKTPIGIVIDEKKRMAVSLNHLGEFAWSTKEEDVFSEKCGYKGKDYFSCRPDGKANTAALIAKGANDYPAAKAAYEYEPAGCEKDFCRKGKWWLPSFREAYLAKSMLRVLGNTSLYGRLVGVKIDGSLYLSWTSNEYDAQKAKDEQGRISNKKNSTEYVRPVVKY